MGNEKWYKELMDRFPSIYRTDYRYRDEVRPFTFECQAGWLDMLWALSLALEEELSYRSITKRLAPRIEKVVDSFNRHAQRYLDMDKNLFTTTGPCHYFNLDVHQVKEKFGTLRFYYSSHRMSNAKEARISNLIDRACTMSENICDVCGEYGALVNQSCVRVRCTEHIEWFWRSDKYPNNHTQEARRQKLYEEFKRK